MVTKQNMDPFSHIKPFSEIVHTNNSRFIVCGMFTKNYSEKANKFLDSINKFKLSNVIYEVPDIHSSISYLGKIDSQFNKPTFIGYLLNRYKKIFFMLMWIVYSKTILT